MFMYICIVFNIPRRKTEKRSLKWHLAISKSESALLKIRPMRQIRIISWELIPILAITIVQYKINTMENTAHTYIVAGASSGIGLELAILLTQHGFEVCGISRNPGPLNGHKLYRHYTHDFLSEEPLPDITDKAAGLVYCPGSIVLKPLTRISKEDVNKTMTLNATAALLFVQHYLANIKNTQDPSIVLFSSVAVRTGMPFHAATAMAKGAVEGLTLAMAAELAPEVRVNAIAPSLTDTPLAAGLLNTEAKIQAAKARHPLNAFGTSAEVAKVAFHVLTQYHWVTGQVYNINGGLGTIIK